MVKQHINVFVTGFPRTGSTMVWQYARSILADNRSKISNPSHLMRSHEFKEKNRFNEVLVCIRDPRDSWVSFCEAKQIPIESLNNGCAEQKSWLKFLRDACRMYRERGDGYTILRYEFFHQNNLYELYKEISRVVDADANEDFGRKIIQDFSLVNAKAISDRLVSFSKYDENMIHGRHVTHNGQQGYWKEYVQHYDVFATLNERVKELDYEPI